MIQHVVALSLREGVGPEGLQDLMEDLGSLVDNIEGFVAFQHGMNMDAEGKSGHAPYGFICTFEDHMALTRYAKDKRHMALGARLVALCNGGSDGVMVYDFVTEKGTR